MKTTALCGVVLLGAMAGCGGGGGGTTSGPVSIDQLPAAYAKTLCDQNFMCASTVDKAGHTKQDCLDQNQSILLLVSGTIRDGQSKGRLTYDAAKMGECLSGIAALSCPDYVTGLAEPAACKDAIVGKVAIGGACQQSTECVGGFCDGADTQAKPPVDGMCYAFVAHGAACTFNDTCNDDDYCDSTTNVCTAKKAGGTPCTSTDECSNSCNTDTNKCSGYAGCAIAPVTPKSTLLSLLGLTLVFGLVIRRRR